MFGTLRAERARERIAFTVQIRSVVDNIYESKIIITMTKLTNEYQRELKEREYIRLDARVMVLSTIDELNQYLLGNVTHEAATDACQELLHKLKSTM